MTAYTPGALSSIFNNSKSDKSEVNEKSDKKLVKLFSKKTSNKRDSQNNITSDSVLDNVTEKKSKSIKSSDNEEKQEKIKQKNEISQKHELIGPTIIPSSHEDKLDSKDLDSNEDEILDEAKPKYTKPSRKYQVKEEDKKTPQFDAEKESRTIFVGNLPNSITGKILKRQVRIQLSIAYKSYL